MAAAMAHDIQHAGSCIVRQLRCQPAWSSTNEVALTAHCTQAVELLAFTTTALSGLAFCTHFVSEQVSMPPARLQCPPCMRLALQEPQTC